MARTVHRQDSKQAWGVRLQGTLAQRQPMEELTTPLQGVLHTQVLTPSVVLQTWESLSQHMSLPQAVCVGAPAAEHMFRFSLRLAGCG